MMEQPKHTLEVLTAMPDAELGALAATKICGWREVHEVPNGRGGTIPCHLWEGIDGGYTYSDYSPATDRNQSGELLDRIADTFHKAVCRSKRCKVFPSVRIDFVDRADDWRGIEVPGCSPRAETIAAILAAQAMEDSAQ